MEKIAASAALGLQESVLGAAVILLVVMLFIVLKLVFQHIKESDKRWSETVDKNTSALNEMTKVHREGNDKIAEKITQALLHSRD